MIINYYKFVTNQMWRATFFATFNHPEIRMGYLDDDDTPIECLIENPNIDWSEMKNLII